MQEYERQKQQKELYEQQLAKATTEQERQILEQQIAEQIEKMGDTQDNILDKASATQEDVKTLRDLQIDQAMKSLMGDAFGITSWTTTKLKWEMNKENAEDFYDKYESTYQKSALKYQYTQLKNSTKNLTLQNKIAKAMKSQMDYLESQTKLSKFEIEYAQKKLSILKAQIALENAQNNKTQLNLQRDSTGNYSYVYTADADEVEKAQQELEQAKNDAYEVAKNQLTTGRDNIESYLDKLNERYKDATDEERAAAIGEAGTTYLKDQWQQMLKAYQYLQEDFGVKNYAELGFLENDEILSTLVSGGSVNWTSLMDTLNTQVSESNADYKEALSNIKTIVDTVEKDVKSISDYFVGSNSSFMEDMDKRLSDDNSALISSLGELIQAVNSAEQTVSNLNEARKKEDKDSWATEVQTATKDTAAQVAKNINNAVEVAGYGMSKTSQGSGGT